MEFFGSVGIAMAVIGLVAILVELALIVPRALRLNQRIAELVGLIEDARHEIEADLIELCNSGAGTEILWKPYRRVLRLLSHPLTIALYESYRRRRARNGFSRQGNEASPVDRMAG